AGAGAAAAAQVVVEGDAQFAGAVVGDPLGGAVQGADVEVVLQVGADPGGVVQHLDPVMSQVVGRADAREHQQLRRIDGAPAQQHLAPGPGVDPAPADAVVHAVG